jgi:putative membrane protein insertion efficiency factor
MNSQSSWLGAFAAPPHRMVPWLVRVALAIIAVYRVVLSPVLISLFGPACRFTPTCSAYATEAIAVYGIGRGGRMALKRLIQCRPLGGWGFDPLPQASRANRANFKGVEA